MEGFSHCNLSRQEWDLLISHHLLKIENFVGSLQDCDFSQESYLKLLDFQDTLIRITNMEWLSTHL